MHIKRFEASTLAAALAQVKAELGPDALILSSRTIRQGRGGFGLLSRSTVEVQAALERRPARDAPRRRTVEEGGDAEEAEPAGREEQMPPQSLLEALRIELVRARRREGFEEELRSELRGLRRLLDERTRPQAQAGTDAAAGALHQGGLDWRHASSVVTEWHERRGEDEGVTLRRVLQRRIEERLAPPRADHGALPRILVGAAGVGKTTTLAKLAGRNEEGERDIALVSLDGYRVGARAQLRCYAELMQTPYLEASSASELPAIVSRFSGRSVLIDTAGRSRTHEDRLEPLLALRRALGRRASIELVVDATARREVQRAQIERFAGLAPDRLILSRIDECESLSDVTNLLLDGDAPPVCWLATGQRVPEDLVVAEPELFARHLFEEAA